MMNIKNNILFNIPKADIANSIIPIVNNTIFDFFTFVSSTTCPLLVGS